jgi:hypothetical protein
MLPSYLAVALPLGPIPPFCVEVFWLLVLALLALAPKLIDRGPGGRLFLRRYSSRSRARRAEGGKPRPYKCWRNWKSTP